ncbi:MAG: peroxiredoxin, partial [Pseudomonadota bacterium]
MATETPAEIGHTAPAFSLPRDGGDVVSLQDFAGSPLVVFFYPKDDTSGCTKEAVAFTTLLDDFAALGAKVIGVSKDSVKKHEKFVAKHGLGMPLLSDEDGDMCERYGVWKEKSMYGKTYMGIERSTFL